jgi:hypothetical protein
MTDDTYPNLTEAHFQTWLEDLLTDDDATDGVVTNVRSLEEAGVLTRDRGLAVTIDGQTFYLTIQKAR